MKRLKVLMSAYSCEPGLGSDSGIGWNVAREMAQHHDVWVITRISNRARIDAELARNPVPGLHFNYFDLPKWVRFWKKGSRGVQMYYYLWQLGMYGAAQKLHNMIHFDLTHHVTFVRYWSPSLLPLLGIPFVWGPVGGGESAPGPMWEDIGAAGRVYEMMRNVARWLGEHDPLVRLTSRKSALAMAATGDTYWRLVRLGCKKVVVEGVAGIPQKDLDSLSQLRKSQREQPVFISIGRLLHWKGFHLGIKAFARADLPGASYWIVGDGPERSRLAALAKGLGVGDRVTFWGQLPREQTLVRLSEADVLVHPSLHDSGGWVCLEAMAAGRPVICLNLGGPATQITDETGIRIPAHAPNQVTEDMADAMRFLGRDEKRRLEMGSLGPQHVRQNHTWETKVETFSRMYEEVIHMS